MKDITAGFIGLGLIGGSIAKAIRKSNPNTRIIAYNRNPDNINKNLQIAKEEGVLDKISLNLEEDFKECDLIFLCAPVLSNIEYLKKLKSIIKSDCILTDVGSVKGNIHHAVNELKLEKNFIGGHPMAGSEKTGYRHSNERLLENAYYILTPTIENQESITEFMYDLIRKIGAIPIILDATQHDDITAAISHVPHIIAASLVNMIKASDDSEEKMRLLAAGGFKDITRIASSSAVMWQNICLTNTKSIEKFINCYIKILEEVKNSLIQHNGDYIMTFFYSACEYRNSIPNKSIGLINKSFEVYLDIIDETGAIATIATILASNNISIKNIGILHNREFQDGVLRIELYDEDSSIKTVELLKRYSYTIYER